MDSFEKEKWFADRLAPKRVILHEIQENIISTRTAYQKVRIFRSPVFGKILTLDDDLQSSEADEFIYHETLVHSAMLTHPSPRRILIIGGGEGATLRECVKYRDAEQIVMVDIDKELVDICKEYLPEWSQKAFNDGRVLEVYDDAKKYLLNCENKFDVIISDLTEPVPDSPARFLLTREFFQLINSRLNKTGIFVIQASFASLKDNYFHSLIYSTLSHVFKIVRSIGVYMPSYCNRWGFIMASDELDPMSVKEDEMNYAIKDRINGKLAFYNFEAHKYSFSLYKPLKLALENQKAILEDNDTSALAWAHSF